MGKAGFFGKVIEKAVSKISGKNVVVSDWTKNRLELLGISKKNITVVPNGVDIELISRIEPEGSQLSADCLTPPGFNGKIYDVIFAGRLIKEKNVDALLKAVSLLKTEFPDIKCCIVGDGPEKASLMELAKKLDICANVKFAGFQKYEALIGKIKASRTLVLPSSREGFGMVVIEAFACGVPVVTVREKYNAAQGLVNDGEDGFVVELGSKEIADGINKLLENNKSCAEMTVFMGKKIKMYSWDAISEQLLLLYMEMNSI
jgi:glycosyltransferase involved in cell wall biosynthesis